MDAADPTGKGGNTNKDVCSRLLKNYRHILVELAPDEFQEDFREFLCRMWVTVNFYTSKEKVDTMSSKVFV